MKLKTWIAGGAASAMILLVGCSSGASIVSTMPRDSQFCKDLSGFQALAAQLEAATAGGVPALRPVAVTVRDQLVKLQGEANADKVNGHAVKDDVTTAVATYTALVNALNAANPSDPASLTRALQSVQDKQGAVFTSATGRLDAYAKQVCGITVSAPAPATTTSVAPIGPVVTAPPSTTAAPSSTAGPTTTPATAATAPATSTP